MIAEGYLEIADARSALRLAGEGPGYLEIADNRSRALIYSFEYGSEDLTTDLGESLLTDTGELILT